MKHMRAVIIENCGHYIAEEQPKRLIEELLRFFRDDWDTTRPRSLPLMPLGGTNSYELA